MSIQPSVTISPPRKPVSMTSRGAPAGAYLRPSWRDTSETSAEAVRPAPRDTGSADSRGARPPSPAGLRKRPGSRASASPSSRRTWRSCRTSRSPARAAPRGAPGALRRAGGYAARRPRGRRRGGGARGREPRREPTSEESPPTNREENPGSARMRTRRSCRAVGTRSRGGARPGAGPEGPGGLAPLPERRAVPDSSPRRQCAGPRNARGERSRHRRRRSDVRYPSAPRRPVRPSRPPLPSAGRRDARSAASCAHSNGRAAARPRVPARRS